MEFRARDYTADEKAYSIPRVHADNHPLSDSSPPHHRVDIVHNENEDFIDPLRGLDVDATITTNELRSVDNNSTLGLPSKAATELLVKEWTSFKRFLMQKFSVSKMISISSVSDVVVKSGKAYEKSSTSMHLEELDDPQKFDEEGVKFITQQEYVARLHELKDEITRAWQADDRVTSLKLSIKVARLLMDTSVLQFYPTVFVLATDIMDMLGDMVWERIKRRAEFSEHGTIRCFIPEKFDASDICDDAKETCYNWFCKIGSIRELLPRIYLELAIMSCWRFLLDRPADCLRRLVMMTRGLADPLASAYCRLYMVHCAQKLSPVDDIGFLITCIKDIKILLVRTISINESIPGSLSENRRLLVSLMEPSIEYIMKCIFKYAYQWQVGNVLAELGLVRTQLELSGNNPCTSVVLHHLLKEIPAEVVSSYAVEILHLIECSNDYSFDQCLNYRLLGFRLCERISQMDTVCVVLDMVMKVVTYYGSLDEYLKVVDAYVDIVLQYQMDNYLNVILDGILKRACSKQIAEIELASLQSIVIKLLAHFNNLEDVLSLNHFVEIFDVMRGSARSIVSTHILTMATRNGSIRDPTTIQFLFEISQALHDSVDIANMIDDNIQQSARLISRFVHLVDHGAELERQLTFLVECRGAFGKLNELKEALVHSSNCLAIRAIQDVKKHLSFVKSCIAFCEVTIPAISPCIRQLNLYLETAEVALLGGLVSHSDGLIDSAISCLQNFDLVDGSRSPNDVDGIVSSIQKLCSLLVAVPGNFDKGITYIPKSILSSIDSKSWITPRMRTRILCAIISVSATLSQNKLPYRVNHTEVFSNDVLFFGNLSYLRELVSLSEFVLQNLVDLIQQEPSRATRGSMALEACNCVASSFKAVDEVSLICSKLLETAKLCLSSNDKYLQSTMKFLNRTCQPPGTSI